MLSLMGVDGEKLPEHRQSATLDSRPSFFNHYSVAHVSAMIGHKQIAILCLPKCGCLLRAACVT